MGCDPKLEPAEEVWKYLRLGASLVQLYTGLIYRGPALIGRINRGLVKILEENGLESLQDFLDQRESEPELQGAV